MNDGVPMRIHGVDETHVLDDEPHVTVRSEDRTPSAAKPIVNTPIAKDSSPGDDRAETDGPIDTNTDTAAQATHDVAEGSDHPAADEAVAEPEPAQHFVTDMEDAPRTGRGVQVFCAVVAVVAAGVTMAAPWLRPQVDQQARAWFGDRNLVSQLVMPKPPPPPKITEDMLLARLAGYDGQLRAMAETMTTLRGDVAQASRTLRDAAAGTIGLNDAVASLKQRADRLDTVGSALEARSRAANLLSLSVGLRRDVDAGLPIDHDCAVLKAMGYFPTAVAHALDQLQAYSAGVPTMRDLAEAYDPVQAQLASRYQLSPIDRGWGRVKSLFGADSPTANEVMFNHLRDLVGDGRFTEAAKVLEASDSADIAADWIGMVRARATAVIATQLVLNHALRSTEEAYAGGGLHTGEMSQ